MLRLSLPISSFHRNGEIDKVCGIGYRCVSIGFAALAMAFMPEAVTSGLLS